MKTIYKYALHPVVEQIVTLPFNHEIRCCQMQGNTPCLWVEVDTEDTTEQQVTVYLIGTGQELPDGQAFRSYIGTIQNQGFVFHVFFKN